MKASDLKVGEQAIVKTLNINNKELKRHLLDMGVCRGTKIKIKKIAPTKDPIDIELRDYELCLCKKDLSKIEVEKI